MFYKEYKFFQLINLAVITEAIQWYGISGFRIKEGEPEGTNSEGKKTKLVVTVNENENKIMITEVEI